MNRKHVLVVEDEQIIALDLEGCLQGMGYDVSVETTGAGAVEAVGRLNPDLVLLDIRLEDSIDGIEAAAQIRKTSAMPLIFVTASADLSTVKRAAQVDPSGFIFKPFNEKQLAANVYLALHGRRGQPRPMDPGEEPEPSEQIAMSPTVLRVGDLEIDLQQHSVIRNGKTIPLTTTEFEILKCLAERPGILVSRGAILSKIWGAQFVHYIQTLRVHIGHLRQKLGLGSPSGVRIEVVRSVGYRLVVGSASC